MLGLSTGGFEAEGEVLTSTVTIDVHGHVVPNAVLGQAGLHGPEVIRGAEGEKRLRIGTYSLASPSAGDDDSSMNSPHTKLAEMDAAGVDILGVSIAPLMFMYWLDPDAGAHWARSVNDAVAAFCESDRDRLFFFATLPLQDIPASLEEIGRARSLGAKGLYFAAEACGRSLADEYFWPVYEQAERQGLPILIHPYPTGQDGDPGEGETHDWTQGDMMSWMVGYLNQETMAVAALLLGGVFDAFPELNVLVTHGGGATPYQFGRLAHARQRSFEDSIIAKQRAQKPLEEYLKNLYFDSVVHDLAARRFLVEFASADNVVVGSNFAGWDAVNGVELVRELALPAEEEEKILSGNATRILGLEQERQNIQGRKSSVAR